MRWDRRYLSQIDWILLLPLATLIGFGMTVISSAAHTMPGGETGFLIRQAVGVGLGLLGAATVMVFDYRDLLKWSRELYVATILLLGAVIVSGTIALGAQRWIKLGPIQFQPSEPAKLLLIITLAAFLSRRERFEEWLDLIPPALYAAIPAALILLQPDLGTSLVLVFILFGMLYVAGAPGWRLVLLLIGGFGSVSAWVYAHLKWGIWIPLKEYQLMRLIVFIDPNLDPTGAGYHILQSRIAIGSGGVWGQGWYQGIQNRLQFLPEGHTDFIFAVLAEEFGLIGGAVVLGSALFLLWRVLRGSAEVEDRFGQLLITGVVSMMTFQFVENIGMTLGIMPITGISLPFVSYGPSAMVTNLTAVGLAMGVTMRRRTIMF